MHFGDLEGKGTIYDPNGSILLHDDECLTGTVEGYCRKGEKRLRGHWRVIFFDGEGCFTFTNKRLVFLREPIVYDDAYKFSGSRFATLSDWEYWANRSNLAKQAGALEFFEIPYDEIQKIKKGLVESKIVVRSERTTYRFIVNSSMAEELERLITEGQCAGEQICFEEGYKDGNAFTTTG